jgi:hypothetical protein
MAGEAATGMIAGAVGLATACAAGVPAVHRWGAIRGSAALWAVWILTGGATAVPVAGGAVAGSGTGVPAGRWLQRRHRRRPAGEDQDDRLFAVDVGALRDIRPAALGLRFAFGAGISVVAGLIGIAAGQRAGGVMLAAPVVLSATLTIIERDEGRGAAVTEVQGAVPGALALIGFALVAAASIGTLPLAAALIAALATWVAAAIGGYLAQSAFLPAWNTQVRDLARQRREAGLARRLLAGSGPQRGSR